MATTVAQLMVQVGANTSEAKQALGSLGVMLSKTGPLAIGGALVAAAFVGIGVASTKMAGDFQSGLATLVTGAGESQSNLQMIHDGILKMSVATGESTQQLINGMFMIESAGYHGAAGLAILQAAAEGAKVGNADLGTVADAVTTVMKDYSSKGVTAAQATNLLIATVASGKTHMQDLADSISTVLPTASKFGISLGDVMGAMATMTSHGVAAANASTYLRQMIVSLEAPTSAGAKALASVGLSAQQVADDIKNKGLPATLQIITDAIGKHFPAGSAAANNAFKEIAGGSRQMQGMLLLTGSSAKEFAVNAAKLGGAASSTSTQITGWKLIQGTFNEQLSRAKAAVEVLMISLGEHLIPVATQLMSMIANGLIPTVQNFITMITGTSTQAEILRPILIAVGIAIAGALVAAFVAWAIAAGAAAVATIAATWPILAIGAAIALLVAGLVWAYKNWGWFRDIVQSVVSTVVTDFHRFWDGINTLIGFFQNLLNIANKVIGVFKDVDNAIAGAVKSAGSVAGGILSHIPGFATGGTMGDTGLAVVGEKGPELLALPGGTNITPLTGSNAISGPPSNVAGAFSTGGASQQPLQSTFVINLDGRQIANSTVKHIPGIIRLNTGVRAF